MKKFLGRVGNGLLYPFRKIYNDVVDAWKGVTKEKVPFYIVLLVVCNVVFVLIANIIAVKTINLASNSGFIGNNSIRLMLPAAVIVYAFSLVCSDLLCELDKTNRWTRISCHIGFILNFFMVFVFLITSLIPGVVNGNPDSGLTGNFWGLLGSTPLMLLAGVVSYYFGDLLNDTSFFKMKKKDKDDLSNKKISKRCILSTMIGQAVDATIFITLGLHIFPILTGKGSFVDFIHAGSGNIGADITNGMAWLNVLIAICLQWVVKVFVELVVLPLVLKICKSVRKKDSDLKEN